MRAIADGLWHWTTVHPHHGQEVSSYYLEPERVLLDPLLPHGTVAVLDGLAPPEHVVLTNRHHWRSCSELIDAFGVTVHVQALGVKDFDGGRPVTGFAFGDELPGGLRAHEVGVLTPEETLIEAPRVRAVALADAVIRTGDRLGFVPDGLLGDDPEAIRAGIADRLGELARSLEPEILLLAHGDPFATGATELLEAVDPEG